MRGVLTVFPPDLSSQHPFRVLGSVLSAQCRSGCVSLGGVLGYGSLSTKPLNRNISELKKQVPAFPAVTHKAWWDRLSITATATPTKKGDRRGTQLSLGRSSAERHLGTCCQFLIGMQSYSWKWFSLAFDCVLWGLGSFLWVTLVLP